MTNDTSLAALAALPADVRFGMAVVADRSRVLLTTTMGSAPMC
jgi:hypothetical protein